MCYYIICPKYTVCEKRNFTFPDYNVLSIGEDFEWFEAFDEWSNLQLQYTKNKNSIN